MSKLIQEKDYKNETCVVVMSGGQDSTTCLGMAVELFKKVVTVSFTYGQKHGVEIFCANEIVKEMQEKFGVEIEQHVINVDALRNIGNSALIAGDEQDDVTKEHAQKPGLPASYVPNRNATFLTLAHALAQKVGAKAVMTGVCQTDYSGYPDCRRNFIEQLRDALNMGSDSFIEFMTPLMYVDKAFTFKLAEEYDVLDIVLQKSHTCYQGDHNTQHEWGFGCGECPSCELRAKGWTEFLERY